jgi:hypothetical protein
VGQKPAGIYEAEGTGYAQAALVANSHTDVYGYNPNRKLLKLNTSVDYSASATIAIPGPFVFGDGFRCAFWYIGGTAQQIAYRGGVFDSDYIYNNQVQTGFGMEPNSVNGQVDVTSPAYQDGTSLGTYDPNVGGQFSGARYNRMTFEWNATTKKLSHQIIEMQSGFSRSAWVNKTPSWANTLTSFTEINRFWFYAYKHVNVYVRDAHLMGFWLGKLTDAYPTLAMPAV